MNRRGGAGLGGLRVRRGWEGGRRLVIPVLDRSWGILTLLGVVGIPECGECNLAAL